MPRYEFRQGSSSKFWEIELEGSTFVTTYGSIGKAGRSVKKEFKSPDEAQRQYEKMVASKVGKGYQLAGETGKSVAPAPANTGVLTLAPGETRDLDDDESVEVKGSGSRTYTLKNTGGVYSCSCPAWRNQSVPIERRTCKHLKKLRGAAAELERLGSDWIPPEPAKKASEKVGPPVLLAESWDGVLDPTGWWVSEKLDGVRAWWTGSEFLSRGGNVFHAPDWFTAALPKTVLDGELWCGRKQFQKTVSIVRRQDKTDQWLEVSYVVFDAPQQPGTFEERLAVLQTLLGEQENPYARHLEHQALESREHLEEELRKVEALGGEGLMVRRPGSLYESGRSDSLLKVKSFQDAEGRVIGHVKGRGRHKGRLGALRIQLENGVELSVGTGLSDAERENPPAIGSQITFRYQELTKDGVPRFPSYVGVRVDLEPEE